MSTFEILALAFGAAAGLCGAADKGQKLCKEASKKRKEKEENTQENEEPSEE